MNNIILIIAILSLTFQSQALPSSEDMDKKKAAIKRAMTTKIFSDETIEENNPYILTGLDPLKKEKLLSNLPIYRNIRTLDLDGLNIDDSFVEKLSQNPAFARLVNINLSNNPNITERSLNAILNSDILGSVRDVRQPHDRSEVAYCEIYLSLQNTGVRGLDKFKAPRSGFTIRYLDPTNDHPLEAQDHHALKYLRF